MPAAKTPPKAGKILIAKKGAAPAGELSPEAEKLQTLAFLASVCRLAADIGNSEAIASEGVGEWAALTALREKSPVIGAALGKRLGVSRQRAKQLQDALRKANLIDEKPIEGKRAKMLSLSASGAARLEQIDDRLYRLAKEAVGSNIQRLARSTRLVRALSRAYSQKAPPAETGTV